jgi:putative FmdB family regulatory protein
MPIFEFKCLSCNECFEILVMTQDEQVESRCPKCGSENFERLLSKTCYTMGSVREMTRVHLPGRGPVRAVHVQRGKSPAIHADPPHT